MKSSELKAVGWLSEREACNGDPNSLVALIYAAASKGLEDDALIDEVVGRMSETQRDDAIRWYVRDFYRHQRRAGQRREEGRNRRDINKMLDSEAQLAGFRDRIHKYETDFKMGRLLMSEFALGDGRHVSWGSATIDDHLQRIALLRKQHVGLGKTISMHEDVIALLMVAKVTCLRDALEGA